MKFSLLLPTRNRLEFLASAIETVRRQKGNIEWEIVVSDNDSTEDIRGHVEQLGDPRVKYVRTAKFVPVTDNWNNALEHSSGDYVLMLGDDDGLLPGALTALRDLVRRFDRPDVVYSSAYLFAYPGVMPDHPAGFLQPYGYARFLRRAREPFVLSREEAQSLVRDAMQFKLRYGFNMQFSTISRDLIDRLADRGPFFQSAFPDYYATNVAFLKARDIVVEPRPLVVIGVTPKSYGFFHAQAREQEGRQFLDPSHHAEERALPGSNINAGWLDAAETIAANYGAEIGAPDRRRYRFLQIAHVHEQVYLDRTLGQAELELLRPHLGPGERLAWRAAGSLGALARRVLPRRIFGALRFLSHRARRQFPDWRAKKTEGRYESLLDVFERGPLEG